MKPFNALLAKEGVKELYKKGLQDKLEKILGTDILQNLEKIGGFGDILINTALSYQELISLKGMMFWDKKNAETDYSEFSGLNHYLYAGFKYS